VVIDVRYTCAGWEVAVLVVHDRIEVDPRVMLGKPLVRRTRITVELILQKLSEGATEADLVDAYPRLTPGDIRAAIGYAAEVLSRGRGVLGASPMDDAEP
jgi:uncharacterized protein (DUF433 family)